MENTWNAKNYTHYYVAGNPFTVCLLVATTETNVSQSTADTTCSICLEMIRSISEYEREHDI